MNSPKSINNYQLLNEVRELPYGLLYQAINSQTQQEVQIALIDKTLMVDQGFLEEFKREIKASARLDHPAVVKILEFGFGEFTYVVMQPRPMTNLKQFIKLMGGRLPIDKVIDFAQQITSALNYAGSLGIWESNLDPDCIWVDADGKIILADLWWYRSYSACVETTAASPYAPSDLTVNSSASQYTLAYLIFHMLTGKMGDRQTLGANLLQDTPFIEDGLLLPVISKVGWNILGKALSIHPRDRFESKEWLKNNLPVCERKGCIIGKKARGYQDGITLFRNYR